MNINIPGIDIDKAIRNSGSEELFTELLGDVYRLIDEKTSLIEAYLHEKDLKNYTVQVHALKTTCRMIGATDLGEDFFTLEKLGKENDLEQAKKLTPDVLKAFRDLAPYLEPYASKNSSPHKAFDKAAIKDILNKLIASIDDFDLGSAEAAAKELFSYDLNEELQGKLDSLDKLVSDLDYDEAKELARQLLESL
jgi:HPt (histidine-containing phosphotransfer) domain-containing protein